jgi:hypothetical protein
MPRHLNQGVASISGSMHANHATSGAMHASHITIPREASPEESERDTWTSHGSMGPPDCLNRLKSMCTPRTDLRTNKTATPRKHTPNRATWGRPTLGSVEPTLGRLIQGLHVVLVH